MTTVFRVAAKAILSMAIGFATGEATASSFTGAIQGIIVQPSPYTSGNVRVSVHITTGTTACSNTSWYAYEYSPTTGSIGQIWTAYLLAAQTLAQMVTINGTGTSDQANVEVLSSLIYAPPQ